MPLTTEKTSFTRDVFGRYVCNTFDEAIASTAANNGGRPFDVIVVGAGSFGGVLAHRLFQLDRRARRHRILVLDAGPLLLTEHVQNLPMMGNPFAEVRSVPWTSPQAAQLQFGGLAICLAGRSLFWGGWSPELTDSELGEWPQALVKDLKEAHFPESKRQIGTDTTNDFIFGPLHEALRTNLWNGINGVVHRFGVTSAASLEAPLAVISAAERAGTYPPNKFSSMQLLMDAARKAFTESNGDDRNKRLMIVPNCPVGELVVSGGRVAAVKTALGDLAVPAGGQAVIALGTIESARLALRSGFPNSGGFIGRNLMAHLRTNFGMRIPRADLGIPPDQLYASALFVKCKSPNGHFHLQITASAAGPTETDSEAELFKRIPSIDELEYFNINDEAVVINIRGVGEMKPDRSSGSANRVELLPLATGQTQAAVEQSANVFLSDAQDSALWADMEAASAQAASALAGGKPFQKLFNNRDALGTTHHEAGTLWMGDSLGDSVTDVWGKFHEVENAWVAGPALFPSVGSPNPMLTGVALARRTAERMFEKPFAEPAGQPIALFNGTDLSGWEHVGAGRFRVENGMLVTEGGLGLLWYSARQFRNFELRVEWKVTLKSDNSGVFVRFPEPVVRDQNNQLVGDLWVAVREGYEIQVDDEGAPDGAMVHKTGSLYGVKAPTAVASKAPGEWNTFVIRVVGQTYNVNLNGQQVITDFTGNRSVRGHVGLQNHLQKDVVYYRAVVATPL